MGDKKDVGRNHSPEASRGGSTGFETPRRTPPRNSDIGSKMDGPEHSESGSYPGSAQHHGCPRSPVAQTPLYYTGWVPSTPEQWSTPSPQSNYHACAQTHGFAESAYLERPQCLAQAPSLLQQQPQYTTQHSQQQQMYYPFFPPHC